MVQLLAPGMDLDGNNAKMAMGDTGFVVRRQAMGLDKSDEMQQRCTT